MKTIILSTVLALAAYTSTAQIESPRPPRSSLTAVAPASKTIAIEQPINSKASVSQPKGRTYYGNILPCDIHFMTESTRTDIAGGAIHTMQLTSQGAFSIGLKMEGLHLSNGSELYIYNNDKTDILGALTYRNNNARNALRTRQIQGDTINIELYVPSGVSQEDFTITGICHDYAGMFGKSSKGSAFNSSCPSETDINCAEGQAFQDIKHAVVLLSIDNGNQSSACSGTIVNNVNCDQTPYVLTAAHCINTDYSAENTIVYFNYELPNCGSRNYPDNYFTMTGATMVASAPKKPYTDNKGRTSSQEYPTMDFTLLKLNKSIPEEYEPYYAGISVAAANMSGVATIHHPQGDVKKISMSYGKPYQDDYPDEDTQVHYNKFCHWHVAQWDVGTTEAGSSGSALLNTEKLIVGILSGGYADCNTHKNDYFQMISKAWDTYPADNNQLKKLLAGGSEISEILPFNPFNIGEKYVPAILSAEINADSTFVTLEWSAMQLHKPTFKEFFELMQTDSDLEHTFLANVDMDNDRSMWTIQHPYAPHSGDHCIASITNTINTTNDYLTLPKTTIKTDDTLKFWAKSEGGVSTLTVGQNTHPSRYVNISTIDITDEWQEYKVPLNQFKNQNIYINLKHETPAGNSTALLIDDIIIDNGLPDEGAPKVSGYEIYCNRQLVETISDTTIKTFTHNVEQNHNYTYYVLNLYEDGGTSNIGNSVTIDLNGTRTPTSELKPQGVQLTAYPNPTTGVISLTIPEDIASSVIEIFDANGRKVLTRPVDHLSKGDTIEISIAALKNGLYILRLDGETIKIQKL